MKKVSLLVLVTLAAASALAQDVKPSDVSPAARRYHDFRQAATEPSFGLTRVKALIKAIKPSLKPGEDQDSQTLATPAWNRLTDAEKFTYCMLHGEVSSQNCDMMPWVMDEDKKVFSNPPPFNAGEQDWSDRQRAFLTKQRPEVVRFLRSTIREKGRVGVNLKAAIKELDAYELIPDLVKVYERDHRDQDILTVLALLMKDGKDKPFLDSITYRKLYGPDANYQSFVLANEANQKLMVVRAMAYYHRRVR